MADIFTLLFHILKHNPKDPFWEEAGQSGAVQWIYPVLYAAMAHAGYFPVEELKTLRKFGTRLQGHPHREYMPWLDTSSGPSAPDFLQAVGMALADKIPARNASGITDAGRGQKDKNRFIYCFICRRRAE